MPNPCPGEVIGVTGGSEFLGVIEENNLLPPRKLFTYSAFSYG